MQQTINLMVVTVGLAIGIMAPFLAVPAVAGDQVNERTGSIDVASIVNSNEPGTKLAGAAVEAGTILNAGGNPSIVITSRSQAPTNEWERYLMESSPQGQKGGILGGGVMAAFRIQL
jgi:hypothetical protein